MVGNCSTGAVGMAGIGSTFEAAGCRTNANQIYSSTSYRHRRQWLCLTLDIVGKRYTGAVSMVGSGINMSCG